MLHSTFSPDFHLVHPMASSALKDDLRSRHYWIEQLAHSSQRNCNPGGVGELSLAPLYFHSRPLVLLLLLDML